MSGLFAGTPFERPVTCEICGEVMARCACPRNAAGRVTRPADQTATIHTEKRKGSRVVTVITGLDPHASDLAALLRTLKAACAAGGTIAEGAIELQGNHRDTSEKLLREIGYRVKKR
ncbi:MAG TPA: translation initiation factor [Phycisphaerales bacterium]|nr:translation initiation factor [Phycisphaerales bacterium]